MLAVQLLAQDVGKKNLLIMDEVTQGFDGENRLREEVVVSMLGHSRTQAFQVFDDLLVLKNGKVAYHGAGENIVEYFCDLGYQCAPGQRVAQFLLNLATEQEGHYRIMVPTGRKPDGSDSHFVKNFAVLLKCADDTALIAGSSLYTPFGDPSAKLTKAGTPSKHKKQDINDTVAPSNMSITASSGTSPMKPTMTEVFRSEEADGSIVTKTIRATRRTVTSSTGALVTTIEVETTTETESTDGTTSTTVATETREETEPKERSIVWKGLSFAFSGGGDFSSNFDNGVSGTKMKRSSASAVTSEMGSTDGAVGSKANQHSETENHSSTKKMSRKSKRAGKFEGDVETAVPLGCEENKQTPKARAAAAWGEEVIDAQTTSIEIGIMKKWMQVVAVRRGYSIRLAFDGLVCIAQGHEPSHAVRGVTGYAESGKMTAVLGAGRQGKAALLGALAGENSQTKGAIYYNGHEVSALVRRRSTGYCWFDGEQTVWHGTTTVSEALCMSAFLRQDNDISESRKFETVQAWLALLGIAELAEQPIEQCSPVETRLVAIGVELAFAPSVLLLDEPTSGLDVKDAQRIVRVLQHVAKTGRTVVCTLNGMVSSVDLRAFDRLLQLSSNGETIFHGECRMLVQYLEGLPSVKKFSGGKSIATWALESVGERFPTSLTTNTTTIVRGGKARTSSKKKKFASSASMSTGSDAIDHEKELHFVQLFRRSEANRVLQTRMLQAGYTRPDPAEEHTPALVVAYKNGHLLAYAASQHTQAVWLMKRAALSYWRSLCFLLTRPGTAHWQRTSIIGTFLLILVWFLWLIAVARRIEYDTFHGVNQGASLIAWSTMVWGASFVLVAVARASRGNAWRESACWHREQAWQAYSPMSYHVCSSVVEMVFVLVLTFVVSVLTFTLFGFWSVAQSGNFSLDWLTLSIFALGQLYLGHWLVRLTPSGISAAVGGAAVNLLPLLTFVWSWRNSALGNLSSWLVMLTPQHYALQGLQSLVFGAAVGSCEYDAAQGGTESAIPCHKLRLIPTENHFDQQLTVHSYAELEYGAEQSTVAFRPVQLGVFLLAFRFLVIVALQKRQTQA
ncbi:unnamed protein product [Phytophthora fragariaefolia]|uniref:Unnamed protein product n=1 Tax=Phytophthora fragariaefolia TaxID=1490495 RepID=A0A9W6YBL1_9STRA|nr:unnamed protein product [Phytophthora fragariaefolia]